MDVTKLRILKKTDFKFNRRQTWRPFYVASARKKTHERGCTFLLTPQLTPSHLCAGPWGPATPWGPHCVSVGQAEATCIHFILPPADQLLEHLPHPTVSWTGEPRTSTVYLGQKPARPPSLNKMHWNLTWRASSSPNHYTLCTKDKCHMGYPLVFFLELCKCNNI